MLNQFLEAGKVINTHGVRGEVKIEPWADSPEFLCGFTTLYVDGSPRKVLSARVHKTCVIALLEGIDDLDGAVALKNKTVSIDRRDVSLEDGRHFITDLIGLRAVDEATDEELGHISEIIPLQANNVYVISGRQEILIPAVPEFVRRIDIEGGTVSFRLIEGMR